VDLDSDGWIDIVVANDTVQNFVFRNKGDGTFEERGALAGVAFDSYGNTRGAMGIDSARYRNDGALGIAIGNFSNEMTALYVSQPQAMSFADEAISEGVGPTSRLPLKFGMLFFDYDLDGWQDLLSTNGHLEEEISQVQASQRYRQPAQLFWNGWGSPRQAFVPVGPEHAGADLFKPIVGRGSAVATSTVTVISTVVFTQVGGPPLLLRNDQETGHRWLRVKLIGQKANRDAIGAVVKLRIGDSVRQQQIMPARSYLSHSELPVTFGLGASEQVDALEIQWPGGGLQTIEKLKLNAVLKVEQQH
jgi:hypothetical protein